MSHKHTCSLPYRAPYDWQMVLDFLSARKVEGIEWTDENLYGRTFQTQGARGKFTASHNAKEHAIDIKIEISDKNKLNAVIENITRILDLNSNCAQIDEVLKKALGSAFPFQSGTKLPGIWNTYEAGIRAILGQQISVTAAHKYCTQLVETLGENYGPHKLFPTPQSVAQSNLDFFRMPGAKKETLRRLSQHIAENGEDTDPQDWINLKGIGPWTVQYVQMRGQNNPDIFMGTDLGVKKIHKSLPADFTPANAAPYRSYLTLQFWRSL